MIQILNKRSSTHPNWCEDNYFIEETDIRIQGAVFDGCSTGINSQFASIAMKYSFEKAINNRTNKLQLEQSNILNDYFDMLIGDVKSDLSSLKDCLNLTDMNLLSTIVFFYYIKETKSLYVKFLGDGVIYVNGNEIVNDENNMPDYLAYHLDEKWDSFFSWIKSRRTEIYENVESFSICSDGIHSFLNLKNPHINKQVAINFLLIDQQWNRLENGLNKKFNILINRDEEFKRSDELYWWDIKDDLTIIKYDHNATL